MKSYCVKHMVASAPRMPKQLHSIEDMRAAAEALSGRPISEMDKILKELGPTPIEIKAYIKTMAETHQVPAGRDKQDKLRQLGFSMTSRYSYKQASDMLRAALGPFNVEQRLEALFDLQELGLLTK